MKIHSRNWLSFFLLFTTLISISILLSSCEKLSEGFKEGYKQGERDKLRDNSKEISPASTPEASLLVLNTDSFKEDKPVELGKLEWKYRAGDDPNWANPQTDDTTWASVAPSSQPLIVMATNEDWKGIGWFRLPINIDESLVNHLLSLAIKQGGASEIYIDGNLVQSYGRVAASASEEETYNPEFIPFDFTFPQAGKHIIAIRYSNASLENDMAFGGFQLQLAPSNQTISKNFDETSLKKGLGGGIFGVYLALGLLHLLLFILYPRQRANLFYSLFLLAGAAGEIFHSAFLPHAGSEWTAFKMFTGFIFLAINLVSFTAYIYTVLENRIPRYIKIMMVIWAVAVIFQFLLVLSLGFAVSLITSLLGIILSLILSLWHIAVILLVIIRAIIRKVDNSFILGLVGLSFVVSFIANAFLAAAFGDSSLRSLIEFIFLIGLVSMNAVILARQFARTNESLEIHLLKEIEHEKERARLAIIESENERRAKELEEARQLQLSMLPKKLPKLPNLEIAAYMKPATEVGGDYYDFHVGKDGTLTVAVGDATGHGLKAGTVVTATKSLFNNLASAPDIPDTLRQISRVLKAMNLRGLFMALTLIKLNDNSLSICAAGMPSTLVYRAATKTVEEISIRAVPLGSVTNFNYRGQELVLQTGDCVVVMSDGFPEMFNEAGEMLGFDKAPQVLKEIATRTPQEIIDRFVEVSQKWACTKPAEDDVTFVVLKIK